MKKNLAALLIFFSLFTNLSLFNCPARAGEEDRLSTEYGWQDKLKRGALNIVTSPVEVVRAIHMTSEEHNLLAGWTWGLVKGLGSGIWRFAGGVVELVTFPFDFPDEDKAPLIEPEYVWQKPGVRYAS